MCLNVVNGDYHWGKFPMMEKWPSIGMTSLHICVPDFISFIYFFEHCVSANEV